MAPSTRTQPVLTPSRLKARRRKRRLFLFGAVLGALVLLLCGVVGFFYIPALRVKDVRVEGVATLGEQALQTAVLREISGRLFFVLPKNNAFLYNEAALRVALHREFPKIQDATIELESFHSLKVEITERAPVALWCGSAPGEAMCYYMDAKGVVYEPAPEYSGTPYVRWFGALPSGEVLGETFAPDTFEGLLPLTGEFEKESLQTELVYLHNNGDVEIRYAGDFTLYFTLNQKPENILKAFHAAARSSVFTDRALTELAYLDLRYSDTRVYYKFK